MSYDVAVDFMDMTNDRRLLTTDQLDALTSKGMTKPVQFAAQVHYLLADIEKRREQRQHRGSGDGLRC